MRIKRKTGKRSGSREGRGYRRREWRRWKTRNRRNRCTGGEGEEKGRGHRKRRW